MKKSEKVSTFVEGEPVSNYCDCVYKEFDPNLKTVYLDQFIYFNTDFINNLLIIGGHESKVNIILNTVGLDDLELIVKFLTYLDCVAGVGISNSLNEKIIFNEGISISSGSYDKFRSVNKILKPYSPYTQSSNELRRNKQSKVLDVHKLPEFVKSINQDSDHVVFVTGVFDVLHPGHIDYLTSAKKNGTILVVLINSDASVNGQSKNKSGDRPVHSLEDRSLMLEQFTCVDYVVYFDSLNVIDIFKLLHNVTYAITRKDEGSQTVKKEMSVIKDNGGNVVIISPIMSPKANEFRSSTRIINETKLYAETLPITLDLTNEFNDHGSLEFLESYFNVDFQRISPTYDSVLNEMAIKILSLNASLGLISIPKMQLDKAKSTYSLKKLVETEQKIIQLIIKYYSKEEFENIASKSVFLIMVFQSIGWNVRQVSYQSSKNKSDFREAIEIKLSDGKISFIDPESHKIHDPFVFNLEYFKLLPGHKNYELRPGYNNFAKRIYYYSKELREAALAVRVIQNNAQTDTTNSEINRVMEVIWDSHNMNGDDINHRDTKHSNTRTNNQGDLPQIVAHGGVAVHKLISGAENSPEGIIKAINLGLFLELDIVPTKDGEWVVSHNVDLSINTDTKGNTTDYTYEYITTHVKLVDKNRINIGSSILGFSEILQLIKKKINLDKFEHIAKIDIKHLGPGDLNKLVKLINKSGIPKSKFIFTAGETEVAASLRDTDPTLQQEINTVEIINFLLSNNLMDNTIVLDLFIDYISSFSKKVNAITVSLMQVALNVWGEEIFHKLVEKIHDLNLKTQVWVAITEDEFLRSMRAGADHVLMHDPELITKCINYGIED
jgi:rfaE bifunctional protein nucleotidyltransferase chain/domain